MMLIRAINFSSSVFPYFGHGGLALGTVIHGAPGLALRAFVKVFCFVLLVILGCVLHSSPLSTRLVMAILFEGTIMLESALLNPIANARLSTFHSSREKDSLAAFT